MEDLFDIQDRNNAKHRKKQYFGGNIKWLVSGDIHKGEIFDSDGRITEEGMKNSNCKLLPTNSVLIRIEWTGETGQLLHY